MQWVEMAIPAGAVLFTAALYSVLPRLRKRDLYFGVTVTAEFRASAQARAIERGYLRAVWVAAGAGLALMFWFGQRGMTPAAALLPLLGVLGGIVGWIRAWTQVRPHAVAGDGQREAPMLAAEEGIPGGWPTAVVPYLVVASALGWLLAHYAELPERFPTHWGASGQPDHWAQKSLTAVVAPGLIGMAVLTLVLLNLIGILKAAKRGSGGETREYGAQHRRGNVELLALTLWMLALVFAVVVLLPVLPPMGGWLIALILAPVAVILYKALTLYSLAAEPTGGTDGMPEECWKWGMVYYNPADPALLVEKRSGPGFTLNFGNRLSWLLGAGLVAVIVLPLALAR